MSLRVQTARGSMIMGIVTFATRPLTIVFSIALLRLLNPDDFGTVALAMILFNTANLFTDFGMRSAVIQTQDDISSVSWFAFIIVNITSIIFYAVTFAFAEPIATFLGGDASLVPILRWLGLIVVLDGLWVIPEALLSRGLKFKQLAIVKLSPELASGILAVILAFMGFGVYSLVYSTILAEAVRVVLYWYLVKDRYWLHPKPWDSELVKKLLRFGLPTMGSGVLRYFSSHWDDWYVGRMLGTTSLGYYSKAYDITTRLTFLFSNIMFGSVLQPSYAKVQNEPERLSRGYRKSTTLVLLTMVPVSFGLAVLAHTIVLVLFGEKWLPMVLTWQIFALYAMTRPISANASPLFLAVGLPKQNLQAIIVLLIVMVPLVLILIGPYGIAGVAVAVSIAHLVGMVYNVYQVNRILPGTGVKTFTDNIAFFVAGIVMVIGVQLAKAPIFDLAGGENWLSLMLLVAIGGLIYVGVVFLLQRKLIIEMTGLAVEALGLQSRFPRFAGEPRKGKGKGKGKQEVPPAVPEEVPPPKPE